MESTCAVCGVEVGDSVVKARDLDARYDMKPCGCSICSGCFSPGALLASYPKLPSCTFCGAIIEVMETTKGIVRKIRSKFTHPLPVCNGAIASCQGEVGALLPPEACCQAIMLQPMSDNTRRCPPLILFR